MVLVRSAKALHRTVPAASLTSPASLFLGWCWSQAHLSPLPGVWPNTSQRLLLKPPLNGHQGLGNLSTRSTGKHGVCQIPVNSMSFYPFVLRNLCSHIGRNVEESQACASDLQLLHIIYQTRVCAHCAFTHTHAHMNTRTHHTLHTTKLFCTMLTTANVMSKVPSKGMGSSSHLGSPKPGPSDKGSGGCQLLCPEAMLSEES